jgi:hypothetical protein
MSDVELQNPHNPFEVRDVCADAKSAASFDKMKRWINNCATSHDQCALLEQKHMPTRLIQLSNHGARLMSPTIPVRYAALTYCWGSSTQSTKTTKTNVTARYDHLEPPDFPQTLQDAIFVTQGLGLEYIWIDSICIVQDDQEEWSKEASTMVDIYSNAHVVLAATAAEDSSQGFLWPRRRPLAIQCGSFTVNARPNSSHDCWLEEHETHFPLFKRGWCMQERLVARRIIHFLADELRFQCETEVTCECDTVNGDAIIFVGNDEFRRLRAMRKPEELPDARFTEAWRAIVEEYTTMRLSYETDKLPALSGIAQSLSRLEPGRYLAGLWEKGLVLQLAWYYVKQPDESEARIALQPSDLPRPTFSWIKVRGRVSFNYFLAAKSRPLATLVSSEVNLLTASPYGQVTSVSICLNGHIMSAVETISCLKDDHFMILVYLDTGVEFDSLRGFQHLPTVMDRTSLVCFGLFAEEYHVTALVLQRTCEASTYVRVGLIENAMVLLRKTCNRSHYHHSLACNNRFTNNGSGLIRSFIYPKPTKSTTNSPLFRSPNTSES